MKLKNHLPLLLSLFLLPITNAQQLNDFYAQISAANTLAKNNQADQAIAAYEAAFRTVDYVNTFYLKKVLKLAKKNKDQQRIKHYSQRIKMQLKGADPQLARTIDSLFIADQKIRAKKYTRAQSYYKECLEDPNCKQQSKRFRKSKARAEEWLAVDSSNIQYLLNLFAQKGYPGEEEIGRSVTNMEIILLHFDKDTDNEQLGGILQAALSAGKIRPLMFAQIQDRHSYYHDGTQQYWTWPCASKGEKLSFSDEEVPQILQRREGIGIYGSTLDQKLIRKWYILQSGFNL
ncbi:MAG: hypothetical protein AAGG75_07535 [Bacteroidota bacterium]